MLCECCKIREANIQYTEVVGGVKTEHNYCTQCAKELDFGPYSAFFDGEFPLGKLLSGLLGVAAMEDQEEQQTPQVICPTCGTSYEEFIKNSCFGCSDCYGVFDVLISDNIKQLQGSIQHKGKHPVGIKKIDGEAYAARDQHRQIKLSPAAADSQTPQNSQNNVEAQIRQLERQLREALRMEDYETAARCRDEIRVLKEGSVSE